MRILLSLLFLFACSIVAFAQSGPGGYGKTTDVNSGLVLWLKADVGVTSSGNGTDVISWDDQSASGLTAIPGGTTGAAPIYDADGGANFNNQPVLFFDDPQDNWMYIEGDGGELDLLEGQSEMSIFFVFNSDNRTGNKNIISKRDGNNSNQQFTFYQNNSIQSRYVQNTKTGAAITVGTTYINTATYLNGNLTQWLNQASGAGGSGANPLPTNDSDFNIGTFENSGGLSFDGRTFEGEIAEIIIYNTYLNEAEKIAVENYLGAKYGSATLSTDDYWDEVTYSGYNNEIAGIGETSGSVEALTATSAILTISGGDAADKRGDWIFWGHDNGLIQYTSNTLDRNWVIDEEGDLGNVTVSVAADDLPSTGLASPNFNLVVNGIDNPMTLVGNNYEVTLDLADGDIVTLSFDSPVPAGVTAPLAFWLDADSGPENGGSAAANGDAVDVWQDLSAKNRDAVNGVSPTFNTVDVINYRPVVSFDGTQHMELNLDTLKNNDYSIMSVVRRSSSGSNLWIMGSETDSGADSLAVGYSNNTTLSGSNLASSQVDLTVAGFTPESPAIVAMDFDGVNTIELSEFRDNSSASTEGSSVVYNAVSLGNLGRAFSTSYFTGDIAELVVFPSELSATDSAALVSNLAIQYGISLNTNYVDEQAKVLWDYTTSSSDGYTQDVTAIGFEESFNLDQRVSKSVADSIVLATSADFTSLNSDGARPSLGDGEFVIIANNNLSFDLDQTFNLTPDSRMNRIWRVDTAGSPGAVVVAIPKSIATLNFMLVSTNDDFFTDPVEQVALIESGDYYYATHGFGDGDYFTFGFDDTEIWYSYKSGVWSDPNNWTLDGAVSALLVNPDSKVPLPGDSVVIKSGKTITADISDIAVEQMEINGTLDLSTTGGHDFNYIFGFGKLRMAGNAGFDNYPDGVDTLFYDRDEGGTVEVYGDDITLDQNRNFRNLIINLDTDANVATMTASSITLTKDLTVTRGDLRFNDNSGTSSVNLTVNGDVLVEPNGGLLVGTGNARHELNLFGDFTNQGLVEFTNRDLPIVTSYYTNEATDGIVDLNFLSADQDQALSLENVARLYRIEIDKGVDDSYIVDITADDASYWNLLGYANQDHTAESQLLPGAVANRNNPNALGLFFGTVRIGTNIDIPRLNGGGNYNVSEGAQIWIDGGSVAKNSGTAIVPYGTIRVTSGTLEADINSGITTRGNATLIIEGGTVTVRQFRTSIFGPDNQGGLVQTGGVFNVTGAGGTNTGYCTFNLTYEGNVFNISGGILNISGPNSKGGVFIGSDPENISTTGGIVNLISNNGNDFNIASRGSFYDLTMIDNGGGNFIITPLTTGNGGTSDRTVDGDELNLTIVNDLSILENSSNTVFDANGYDVGITGTLTVEAGASMIMANNTLTFEGEGTSFVDIQTTGPLALDSLVINKTFNTDLVRLTNGPNRAITIANYYNHQSGQFDYLADTIVLSGELVLSDTIGLSTSTGELLLDGVSRQTITSSGGYIYDLVLDNAGDSLSGNLVVDSLVLDGGVFDIGANKLTIISNLNTNNSYSTALMIQSNGRGSDGSLEFFISSAIADPDPLSFPIGTDANSILRYTPATLDLINVTTDGYVGVSLADAVLPTTDPAGGEILSYYWKLKHNGFTTVPDVTTFQVVADESDDTDGGDSNGADDGTSLPDDWVTGKVEDNEDSDDTSVPDINFDALQTSGTIIGYTITYTDNDDVTNTSPYTLSKANYTIGDPARFATSPTVFYSRKTNNSDQNWNTRFSWSTVATGDDATFPVAAASRYPGQSGNTNDIVIIGAHNTTGTYSQPIRMAANINTTVAAVLFEETETNESSGRLFPRAGTNHSWGEVSGAGEIQNFFNNSGDVPTYVEATTDFGGFFTNENSVWNLALQSDGTAVMPSFPDEFPNLRITTSTGGSIDGRIITFANDITVNNGVAVANRAQFLVGGNVSIANNLDIGVGFGNGRVRFPNGSEAYTVEVGGNLNLGATTGGVIDDSFIDVQTGNTNNVTHELFIGGNITINENGNGTDGFIDLYLSANENQVLLTLNGTGQNTFTNNTNQTPDLYRMVINKGTDTTSTFSLNSNFTLNGDNTVSPQSLELTSGKLIVNNSGLNIELVDASEFLIPLGAGLEVTQGTVTSANDASINLDGLLRINGGTATFNDTDIIYSNTGAALIDVSSGALTVGNQIRRPITSSSGILKYRQTGGSVLIGADGESQNKRAMFEVVNPGSEFTLTGGDFTIRRGVTGDDNPSLELSPDVYDVTGSTVTLGDASTPLVSGSNFFNIKSAIALNNLTITNDVDFPVARAFSLALTVDGTLEIQANGDFDANSFQITLNGDLDNEGTFTNDDDLTLFSAAGAQEIRGGGSFTFFNITKDNTGTLTQSTGPIAVNNDLRVEQGILALGTNVLELKGDAYITSTVTNGSGGYLSFNSDTNNQNLYGRANNTITLGKIQIDNPLGVDITDGFGYNFDITEELALLEGVFNVGGSLVTVKEGAFITGDLGGTAQSDFSISNMVQTNSSFVDNGLKIEYFTLGSDSTLFFPVGEQKYTPVAFDLLNGSEGGSLRVRPANERHPTVVNNVEPNPDISVPPVTAQLDLDDITNVLQYYWIVVADNIDGSGIEGSAMFFYNPDDISIDNSPDVGDPTNSNNANPAYGLTPPTSFTTADYVSARLLSNGTQWDKFTPDLFDESANSFEVPLGSGILAPGITGDYTAGVGSNNGTSNNIEGAIPDEIVEYISVATGSYGTDANWSPNPETGIGPVGGRVTISAGNEITINLNGVRLYETIIDLGGTLIVDETNFGHRLGNVRGTGTIQLQNTGDLPAGEYSEFFDCNGGALDYAGSDDYNVLGAISQIRKVSFTGTGQRIMPSNILEVCDTLYVNGPTLGPSISLNTGQTITVGEVASANDLFWIENGAVTLSNSTVLDVNGSVNFEGGTFTGGSGTTIYIYENLSRTATTLNWNNTTVRFDGAVAQTITGDFQGTRAFDNIRINNTSSTGITLSGNVDIDGLLTFQDGHFYTSDANSLRLTASGTKTGASSASHVKGPMTKNSVAASSSYTFPVGKGTRYAPVTIVDVGTGSDNWTAEYFQTNLNGTSAYDAADVGSGRGALSGISNDMWRVQSAGTNTAKIRVTYGAWHDSSDPSALRLAWWDAVGPNTSPAGARWENQGGIVAVTSATTGTVVSETTIGFSSQDFTLGATSEDALPVEMLYFEGAEEQGIVQLDWATATEIDNDHFEVQRSQNGMDWEVIGVVSGAGTTVEEQQYDFTDIRPYVGNSYYRLRQVDFDGKFAFTDIILVNVRLEAVSFAVYPNPIQDVFTVDIKGINANEEAPYSIISLQGAYVGEGVLKADEAGRINEQLSMKYGQPSGLYILRVGTSQRVFRFNLIKK